MRLDEIRKDKLIANAHRLHSGKGLRRRQLKEPKSSWHLTLAMIVVVCGLGLVFYAGN